MEIVLCSGCSFWCYQGSWRLCWVLRMLYNCVCYWITGKGHGLHMVPMLPPPHLGAPVSHTEWWANMWITEWHSWGLRAGSPALACSIRFRLLYLSGACLLGGNTSKPWHLWRKGCADGQCLKRHAFLYIHLGLSVIHQLLDVCSVDACICLPCSSSCKLL